MKLVLEADWDRVQEDIQVLVSNLKNKNKAVRSDCIKVLYEVGAEKPELIEMYVDEFVAILTSTDNRLVWGAMTALGSIVSHVPHNIWEHIDIIIEVTQRGSVITQDWGIRILAALCAANEAYSKRLFPFLITFLKGCQPKDVPCHAESTMIAPTTSHYRNQLRQTLEVRKLYLKASQLKRVEKVIQHMLASEAG